MTPHDIHYGLAGAKWRQRAEILHAAYQAYPERFPRGVSSSPAAADGGLDQQAPGDAGTRPEPRGINPLRPSTVR
jgi:hypothetical protein